jgi:transcriptional regulator with XRE-family HTH domain
MSGKNTDQALATIVRNERQKRNWTQEHLAQIADVSTRTIQRLETDGAHSPETLRAVATAFDIDCKEMIEQAKKRVESKGDAPDPYVVVQLIRCRSGKALLDRLDCHAHHSDYPADLSSAQAHEVGWLFDFIKDFGDIRDDLPISHRIECEHEVTAKINYLDEMGLAVFCGAYRGRLPISG